MYKQTNCKPTSEIIRKHRWSWIGHILRLPPSDPTHIAFTWALDEKRKKRCLKLTWHQIAIKERNSFGWPRWGSTRDAALDRQKWKDVLEASCATSK